MQDLTVIGIENGALLVASETGERYRVAIDEVLQSRLRQSTTAPDTGVKVSPREIQAQIRAGMSAEDVARATGASLEYVERFEGPVVAERLHIVSSALRVPVKVSGSDPLADDQSSTFGETIEERLEGLGATDLRWASWKEETGWIVKLTFTASEIDHDARWQFDPKRHSLTPLNSGAVTLSQQGEIVDGLIPRLRAVDSGAIAELPSVRGQSSGVPAGVQPAGVDTASGTDARRVSSPGLDLEGLDQALEPDEQDDPAASSAGSGSQATASSRGGLWGGAAAAASSPSDTPAGPTAPPVFTEPTPFSRSPYGRTAEESSPAAAAAAVTRQPPGPASHNETADLLEALRRRRGEREAAPFNVGDEDDFDAYGASGHPSTRGSAGSGSVEGETRPLAHLSHPGDASTVTPSGTRGSGGSTGTGGTGGSARAESTAETDSGAGVTTLDGFDDTPAANQRQTGPQSRSKRRTAMPSWDEIVFGARSDDDLN
ncbi:MAG: hypothetical protein JWQ19_2019 [Subtercola sp.]|nr:hypothetical protein [Subtercola sp.]